MNLKLIIIHIADIFDVYVLHGILDSRLVNYFWDHKWYNNLQDFHMKICEKICMSEWWGEEECFCSYCEKYKDEDI